MTREQLRQKAQRLRAKGLTYREVGDRLGMTTKQAWRLCNRAHLSAYEKQRNAAKREWDRAHYRKPCEACGAEIDARPQKVLCMNCDHERRRKRFPEVCDRWNAGESLTQIAEALGTTVGSIGTTIVRMREQGWDLPYRRLPSPQNAKHPELLRAA